MSDDLNKHEVHALSFETEYDFRRKSGPIELVCVFKASGGYDIYHPSDVPHLIQKLPDEKIALHKGKYREGEAKAKFDSALEKIGSDMKALKNTVKNPDDAELTDVTLTSQDELGIDFKDITQGVETVIYTRLSSLRCCIPLNPPFYC
ncbi:MAG: hypothetical protein V3V22_08525 [Methylococcales bacterium]